MLCDPRAESLIENFINVVPPIQQARTQLNSVAAFARPDGPDGTRGLLARPSAAYCQFSQRVDIDGCTAREIVRSRIENDLWQVLWWRAPARPPEYTRYEQTSDVSRLHTRSGQYQNKA